MKQLLLMCLFIFFCMWTVNSQQITRVKLVMHVSDYETGEKLSGISVTIYKKKTVDSVYISDTSGRYLQINIDPREVNRIVFTGEGYMKKIFVIDLRKMPNDVSNNKGVEIPMPVDLVKQKSGEQCLGNEMDEMQNQVFSTLTYLPDADDFEWDLKKFSHLKSKMKECHDAQEK